MNKPHWRDVIKNGPIILYNLVVIQHPEDGSFWGNSLWNVEDGLEGWINITNCDIFFGNKHGWALTDWFEFPQTVATQVQVAQLQPQTWEQQMQDLKEWTNRAGTDYSVPIVYTSSCECGSEAAHGGPTSAHSHWCPQWGKQ
jgi:hypothetical protein